MDAAYPADLYVAVHTGTPGDIEFYRRCCADARSVLELGCGHGRILFELDAPERTGVEQHPGLLELARARPGAEAVRLIEGDMVDVPLVGEFERVIIPYCGIYCLGDTDRLEALLTRVHECLAADGMLIFDGYAADAFHEHSDPSDLAEDEFTPVKTVECRGTRFEVLESSRWDRHAQRIDVQYLHVPEGSDQALLATITQRYLLSVEVHSALSRAGFVDVQLYGDFDGTPPSPNSELLVVQARRGARCRSPDDT